MAGVLAATVAVLVVVAYLVTNETLARSLDRALSQEADAYSAAMSSAPTSEALDNATRTYLLGRTGGSAEIVPILVVRFGNGRILSNSELRIEDAVGNDLDTVSTAEYRTIGFQGVNYRVLAVPVMAQGTRAGVFIAVLAIDSLADTAREIAFTLLAAGLIALAVGLLLSYGATRGALAPLSRMAADAASVTEARLNQRIEYGGPADELGSLAESLNQMLDRLHESFENQKRFIADASHELRTPLAIIRGNVELLRAGTGDGASADESLEMIESESIRMTRLLDELLALARLESAEQASVQPLQVETLLTEASARGRALGTRNVTVEPCAELWVEGHPDMLDQALANLIRNALAHTGQAARITLGCARIGDTVEMWVADDGPGMPEADLDRVFDRFYRAQGSVREQDSSGAGLGLAITKRLVELHGGSVQADNVYPHGARFTVRLPAIERPD